MPLDSIKGKTALVTGAGRGIGRAIAVALAGAGANIAINYRSDEDGARAALDEIKALGRRGIAIKADVSAAADVRRLIESVVRDLGTPTILVNNAGIVRQHTFEEITERDWDDTLAVNLKSMFLVTQAALPHMRTLAWGRIINISSVAAQVGGAVGPHYSASKAGVFGLTHYYASILAKEGITANTVAPGPVSTDLVAGLPELRPYMMPIGRFGTPEEVADVVLMLARNGNITGQTINVNGGRYMG